MASTILTPQMITKAVLAEVHNQAVLIKNVDRQFENEFKDIGNSIDIRRPIKYLAKTGADASGDSGDIFEAKTTLALNVRKRVLVQLTGEELTLDIRDPGLRERHIRPMASAIVQSIESEIANQYKYIGNLSGTRGSTPATTKSVGAAVNLMKREAVPMNDGMINGHYDPDAALELSDGVITNNTQTPDSIALLAIQEAKIRRGGGANLFESNSIARHTVGALGGTLLVNGASQNVNITDVANTMTQTLVLDGATASVTGYFLAGDVITLAGVAPVQAKTNAVLPGLKTFTVTADADSDGSGNVTVTISPPMIVANGTGFNDAYANVSAAPADNAAVTVLGTAGTAYPENLVFHKLAITLGMAKLVAPDNSINHTEIMDGLSLTYAADGNIDTYNSRRRIDALFGVKVQLHEWAVRHTG